MNLIKEVVAHIETGAPIKECGVGGMQWSANFANTIGYHKYYMTKTEWADLSARRKALKEIVP